MRPGASTAAQPSPKRRRVRGTAGARATNIRSPIDRTRDVRRDQGNVVETTTALAARPRSSHGQQKVTTMPPLRFFAALITASVADLELEATTQLSPSATLHTPSGPAPTATRAEAVVPTTKYPAQTLRAGAARVRATLPNRLGRGAHDAAVSAMRHQRPARPRRQRRPNRGKRTDRDHREERTHRTDRENRPDRTNGQDRTFRPDRQQ